MSHCSGIVYEGMWAGGLPIVMASKLVIKMAADPLTIIQGELFSVEVVCQNEAGEVVPGRRIWTLNYVITGVDMQGKMALGTATILLLATTPAIFNPDKSNPNPNSSHILPIN